MLKRNVLVRLFPPAPQPDPTPLFPLAFARGVVFTLILLICAGGAVGRVHDYLSCACCVVFPFLVFIAIASLCASVKCATPWYGVHFFFVMGSLGEEAGGLRVSTSFRIVVRGRLV